MELRPHQKECIENIKEYKSDRGLINMFCGSGKSLIIYDRLLDNNKKLNICVFPSINLIIQFNNDYLHNKDYNIHNYNYEYDNINICSHKEYISESIFTCDEIEIESFILRKTNKIILVTYQSLSKLATIINNNNLIVDLTHQVRIKIKNVECDI